MITSQSVTEETCTIDEAAKRINRSYGYVYRRVVKGEIPAYDFGIWEVSVPGLDAYIASRRNTNRPAPSPSRFQDARNRISSLKTERSDTAPVLPFKKGMG